MNKSPQIARDAMLTVTDASQGSPRRSTLRILVTSMAILAVIGAVMLAVFWNSTPQPAAISATGYETPTSTAPEAVSPQSGTTAPAVPSGP
jgi:hypothetical protein